MELSFVDIPSVDVQYTVADGIIHLIVEYDYVQHDTWGYYEDSTCTEKESYEIITDEGWVEKVKKFDLSSPTAIKKKWWDDFTSYIKPFWFDFNAPIEPQLEAFIKENMATESDFGDTVESMLAFIHGRYLVG